MLQRQLSRAVVLAGTLLLSVSCASSLHPIAIKGEAFAPLAGLRLDDRVKISPAGTVQDDVLGVSSTSFLYRVEAPVSVQVACYGTVQAEFASRSGTYDVLVTADPESTLRTAMLKQIYDYWNEKPASYVDGYENLPANDDVVEKHGQFLLYIRPGSERPGDTITFYANHRVFRVRFVALDGDGAGALSMFVYEHIGLEEGGELFSRLAFAPTFPPRKLMKMVEQGTLHAPADIEGDESGLIPMKIHSFVRQNTHITILVYEFGDSAAASPGMFYGSPVRRVMELDPARATATLKALTSASTYSTSHIACFGALGTGIGLRLRGANGNVDLIVDLLCKHVIDAEAHEEIGFLSRSGEAFLKGIAADAHE